MNILGVKAVEKHSKEVERGGQERCGLTDHEVELIKASERDVPAARGPFAKERQAGDDDVVRVGQKELDNKVLPSARVDEARADGL